MIVYGNILQSVNVYLISQLNCSIYNMISDKNINKMDDIDFTESRFNSKQNILKYVLGSNKLLHKIINVLCTHILNLRNNELPNHISN